MSCLLLKHKDFIKQLSELKKKKKSLVKRLKLSKNGEVKALSELTFNLLNGNVYCSNKKKQLLKPQTHKLRVLGNKKLSIKKKEKVAFKGWCFFYHL